MLLEGDACLGSTGREALHEPRRLHGPVVRMEDRAAKVRAQMRELVVPVRVEAVLTQRLELRADLGAFFVVGGQAQTADSAEGLARHGLQPVERVLGATPELLGGLGAIRFTCDVVHAACQDVVEELVNHKSRFSRCAGFPRFSGFIRTQNPRNRENRANVANPSNLGAQYALSETPRPSCVV